jgi:hypothetical protein
MKKLKKEIIRVKLSSAALKLLIRKAEEAKETIDETAEKMIMEFSPSTPEEKREVNKTYKEIRDKFVINYKDATPAQIWRNGFHFGWKLFQLRKSNSMFKKYKKYLMD